jgi:hypothetical protein
MASTPRALELLPGRRNDHAMTKPRATDPSALQRWAKKKHLAPNVAATFINGARKYAELEHDLQSNGMQLVETQCDIDPMPLTEDHVLQQVALDLDSFARGLLEKVSPFTRLTVADKDGLLDAMAQGGYCDLETRKLLRRRTGD